MGGYLTHIGNIPQAVVDVLTERDRQDEKWGEQNWPDGTSAASWTERADWAKVLNDLRVREGSITWLYILQEEMYEAFAEEDPVKLRSELVQVAAVAVNWIETIDRRSHQPGMSDERGDLKQQFLKDAL
jgi:hypothetical protein